MPPEVAIILNGISRKKKLFYRELYPELARKFVIEIFETQHAGHAAELASRAVDQRFKFILAAGGDGTLHQVINGIQRNNSLHHNVAGLIPLGTGNDFARTCGLSPNVQVIGNLIEGNQPRPVDLGMLTCHDPAGNKIVRYFVNACSVGMGPAVVKRLATSNRILGPTLTYWKAITATFLTHRPQEICIRSSGWDWQGKIRVLAVANARSFGNALFIAPDARVDDGLLNVFMAGALPLLKFLVYQQAMKSPRKIKDASIHYKPVTRLTIDSTEPCAIEAEGELVGFLPAAIEILPGALPFLR